MVDATDKSSADAKVFAERMKVARGLLRRPKPRDRTWPALAAAALFAAASVAFVVIVVLAPAPPAALAHSGR